ncbi:MAG TPA: hypothetical protein VNN09_15060 [Candidatus Competibacteraceae bacterium]|nr:hypothetical protein [Candidatus Competibacteraceae bacterium]
MASSYGDFVEAYLNTQQKLWDLWLEVARRLDETSAPAGWGALSPLRAFQSHTACLLEARRIWLQDRPWLQQWANTLDRANSEALAFMLDWNQRCFEREATFRSAVFKTWLRGGRDFYWGNRDEATPQASANPQKDAQQATTPPETAVATSAEPSLAASPEPAVATSAEPPVTASSEPAVATSAEPPVKVNANRAVKRSKLTEAPTEKSA